MYATKKSEKPALDEAKVEKLLFLVNKCYGHKDDWDEKTSIKNSIRSVGILCLKL